VRQILLLRGINLGPRNRVAMPALREALGKAGFEDVATYVQSGNIVVSADTDPDATAARVHDLIAEVFDLDIAVVARTRDEIAAAVERNPLPGATEDPKRYQVSFFSAELDPEAVGALEELAVDDERVVALGREVYAYHPSGVARSKLWNKLAGKDLGATGTARNWTTVTKLLELADR
jgi:uncharacterized protein (DUF1697 family)